MYSIGLDKKDFITWIKKITICAISIFTLGISIAINTRAMLGNDPISVFYDGLGISLGINMGVASNIINCVLAVIVFIIDRRYIHIGTLIYAIGLGLSITFGFQLYDFLGIPNLLTFRILSSIFGYLMAFISLSAFMAIDIGIDPWTAIAVIISNKIKKSFGRVKAFIDTSALIVGFFLKGTVGIMTLIAAFLGGPLIQKISEFLDKLFARVI